jgi:hypothetical protein
MEMSHNMSNQIVNPIKVAKIKHLIDRQILLHVEQLAVFVQLKKVIDNRMDHGRLYQSDLDHIRETLMGMGTKEAAARDYEAAARAEGWSISRDGKWFVDRHGNYFDGAPEVSPVHCDGWKLLCDAENYATDLLTTPTENHDG